MARNQQPQSHILASFAAATPGLLAFRTYIGGTVNFLQIDLGTGPVGSNATFTVYRTPIATGVRAALLTAIITAGTKQVLVSSINQATNVGDLYEVELTTTPGAIGNPITVCMDISETGASLSDAAIRDRTTLTGAYDDYPEQGSDPSAPASGYIRIYAKTDHKVYKRVSAGTVTELGASVGGSASRDYPYTPPASPHAANDEFDATTLDAKWTATITSGAVYDINTTVPSCFMLMPNASDKNVSMYQSFVPGAATRFSITAGFYGACNAHQQNYNIQLWDATGATHVLRWVLYSPSGGCQHYCDYNNAFTGLINTAFGKLPFSGRFFLHIERDTSNVYRLWFSECGISWIQFSSTVTLSTTVGRLTVFFGNNGATTNARMGIDFLRVNWLYLPS